MYMNHSTHKRIMNKYKLNDCMANFENPPKTEIIFCYAETFERVSDILSQAGHQAYYGGQM